jgi:hypothetical protein
MSEKNHIVVAACATEGEQDILNAATRWIERAVTKASGTTWKCVCVFDETLAGMAERAPVSLCIASLIPEVDKIGEAWPLTEKRLRASYAALAQKGVPVFVCTVLRHLSAEIEMTQADAMLLRVRRLNLLAAQLSLELGLYVVDVDRVLADGGARRFATDYRLTGGPATEVVAHFIATTVVTHGLEAVAPVEIHDTAREFLLAARPEIPGLDRPVTGTTLKKDLVALGRGRQRQSVAAVAQTVEQNYAGWLVRQVLRGSIGPAEAMQRLVNSVRRRGVRGSATMLASGLSRQIPRKK